MSDADRNVRVLLIDEDAPFVSVLGYRLEQACRSVSVNWKTDALAVPGYDIYIVNHRFAGASIGCDLMEQIRILAPEARICLLSEELPAGLLKHAIRFGIHGAFSKADPQDDARLMKLIRRLSVRLSAAQQPAASLPARRSGLMRELIELLSRWNERLKREEAAR